MKHSVPMTGLSRVLPVQLAEPRTTTPREELT